MFSRRGKDISEFIKFYNSYSKIIQTYGFIISKKNIQSKFIMINSRWILNSKYTNTINNIGLLRCY